MDRFALFLGVLGMVVAGIAFFIVVGARGL
jgi:hypothetical protein